MTQGPFDHLGWQPAPPPDLTGGASRSNNGAPTPAPSAPMPAPVVPVMPAPAATGTRPVANLHSFPLWATTRGDTWQNGADGNRPDSGAGVGGVDWAVVDQLRERVADRLDEDQSYDLAVLTETERRAHAEPVIRTVVTEHAEGVLIDSGVTWPATLVDAYAKAVTDALLGQGRLQPLFEIPDAENIWLVGNLPVVVDHNDGTQTTLPPVANSDQDLLDQMQHMAQNSYPRRRFDPDHVDMTLMIQDRFRVHAIHNEIAIRPSVVIRQHLMREISLGDLADRALMPPDVAKLLDQAVQANKTIVVAGEQGVGKTTLLRALVHAIPRNERFATVETDLELFAHLLPGREHTLVLYARDGMGERDAQGNVIGTMDPSQMIPLVLRQSVLRIVVGELRTGPEASAMFQAMKAGAGTMSSVHSPSPDEVALRLADLVALGGTYSLTEAERQVGLSVDLVVFVRRRDAPHGRIRFIESIKQITGLEAGHPTMKVIYSADTWTGQPVEFDPGELAAELARFNRDLDRLETR